MTDADNQDTSAQSQSDQAGSKVDAELAKVNTMLEQMNSQFQQFTAAAVEANKTRQTTAQNDVSDDDVYEPAKLRKKIMSDTTQVAREMMQAERAKDLMIYNLAQEYPEVRSGDVQKSVLEAQKSLRPELRDTAEGYEVAVLKAAAKHGLVPKSKRPNTSIDDDYSAGAGGGSGSGNRRETSKGKVDPMTIEFARLIGRDVSDPKVLKGLEEASKRTKWSQYK